MEGRAKTVASLAGQRRATRGNGRASHMAWKGMATQVWPWHATMSNPKDHSRDRNWLEELLRRVPGFRGYLEKEYRRESDKLQRDWMADCLQRAKAGLEEAG